MNPDPLEEMIKTNERQRSYYDHANGAAESQVNGAVTNLYRRFRRRLFSGIDSEEIKSSIAQLHREWIGDVQNMKVLDLGVGDGNPLTLELATHARTYVAIDLAPNRIAAVRQMFESRNITGAKLYSADFLDKRGFQEMNFDIIYAMAVFHHFRDLGAFLKEVETRLAPGGRVITLDPLMTWIPARALRALYRPFQTDKDWEWPITHAGFYQIKKTFDIRHIRGLYGQSKWALPLGLLNAAYARRKGREWHQRDLRIATDAERIDSCLQVTMCLKRR